MHFWSTYQPVVLLCTYPLEIQLSPIDSLNVPIQVNTVSARNVSPVWASTFDDRAHHRLVVFKIEYPGRELARWNVGRHVVNQIKSQMIIRMSKRMTLATWPLKVFLHIRK